jgi:hypothetical protein
VNLPPRSKPFGHKWIFKRKIKVDGTIDKYKAGLVIKDFKQQKGLDYFNIYSHVSRITFIKILIVITVINKLEINQIYVKTIF